jgi:hypothetical protein
MCYEGTFDIAVFQTQFNIATVFKLLNKCFDGTLNYKVRFELEKGVLRLIFECLVDGFLEIQFQLRLYECMGTEKEIKLIAEIEEQKKIIERLENQIRKDVKGCSESEDESEDESESETDKGTVGTYPYVSNVISEAVIDDVKYKLCDVILEPRGDLCVWVQVKYNKNVYLVDNIREVIRLADESREHLNGIRGMRHLNPRVMSPRFVLKNGMFIECRGYRLFKDRQWCDFTHMNVEKVLKLFNYERVTKGYERTWA